MKTKPPRPTSARERLLRAAAVVFARQGLSGATTRAIAEQAGVNEVTLFRHFRTKERLLSAVVHDNFGAGRAEAPAPPVSTGDLRHDLTAYAQLYERRLEENMPLIRAMVGEIQHHGRNEREVFQSIFWPLRQALVQRLEVSRAAGEIRCGAPHVLADLFAGMIFTGVLRRAAAHVHKEYSGSEYLKTAVDILLRGATAR